MPNYNTYTPLQLIEAQEELASITGEIIEGALGGLPVASQNQNFFAVFDEAGSTGPEIIDRTQFRITYLVDPELKTSKPTVGSPAAFNMTQNFEKSKIVKVRADNATVLNQNITGEQTIYDVGTLKLITTTEYGTKKDEYITTMSFNGVNSQLVGQAQDLSTAMSMTVDDLDESILTGNGEVTLDVSNVYVPISQSNGTDEYITYENKNNPSAQNPLNQIRMVQSTVAAETRIRFVFGGRLMVQGIESGGTVNSKLIIRKIQSNGVVSELAEYLRTSFYTPNGNRPGSPNDFVTFQLDSGFINLSDGDKINIVYIRTGNSTNATSNLGYGTWTVSQETPPGDVLIMGVNATTSSYWDGFNTVSGSGIDPNDPSKAYSILTASAEFGNFANGTYIQRLATASAAFDPNGDSNTFNPIQTPFEFKPADEIRFEYNKNKVHKILKTEFSDERLKVFIYPSVDTENLQPLETLGTQLNHFTHYRIDPDGGYIFIDKEKENTAGVDQAFNGIITPLYSTEALKAKEDEVIFELKQAGIIET